MTTQKKYCKACDTIKDLDNFYRGGSNSYQTRCKPCHIIYRQELRIKKKQNKPERKKPISKINRRTTKGN